MKDYSGNQIQAACQDTGGGTMGENQHLPCYQMFLAKALFDNVAETPDELAFRRGDVITVLDQDTEGLDGWWLCSLRGRQGIAPGNRLKILSGMGEGPDTHTHNGQPRADWQRTLEKSPSKVVMPGQTGDLPRSMEDYDVPPSRQRSRSKEPSPEPGHDLYDTPTSLPVPPSSGSVYATPCGSRRASCERTPPGSQRASMDSLSAGPSLPHRLSGDGGQPLHYQTLPANRRASADSRPRRLSAAERLYETPPGSKRASVERGLGDDQPIYDTPSPGARPAELSAETAYDTPNPGSRRQSRDSTGAGSRASVVSSSSESCMSGSSSNLVASSKPGSLPDSARSSLEASLQDAYELSAKEGRALKQLSMDSGLGLYDGSAPGRQQPPSPQPAHVSGSVSHSQLSDYSGDKRPSMDLKRSHSLEHALDDIYDSPRNNAPRVTLKPEAPPCGPKTSANHDPHAVYDVPPQVTRDSVISARSDSSDDSLRLSSCSTDSRGSGPEYSAVSEGQHEELLLDLDSALELLVKRQQDVTRASSRVLAFVSPAWRSAESLQTQVMDIRMACGDFRKAVGEFVEFAQGTVANAVHLSDRKLANRLMKQVGPLQQQQKTLLAAVRALEDMRWQITRLADPPESESPDDLATVVSLAQDLVPQVKKLASFIQGNGATLFKRSGEAGPQSRGGEDSHVVSKPPIGPRSDLLAKPGGGGGNGVGVIIPRLRSVQQRPLPAPPLPLSERPLPPTPLQQKLRDLELAGALDNLTDYINVEGMRRASAVEERDGGDRDYSDLQQDYDYVQIDSCDAEAQRQSKDRQRQAVKNAEEELDTPNTPTPDKRPEGEERSGDNNGVIGNAGHTSRYHPDIDRVSSTESDGGISNANEDQDEGIDSPEELKTPMNKMNGFSIPDGHYGSTSAYVDLSQTSLSANDKQVLVYYSGQLETHSTLLNNAIDAFFTCIENNEPPKVFISNSKFVIVTAHKLVYISDALHRNLMNCVVRSKVMQCVNNVCDCLTVSVQATKTAALQYPSVSAVQEMVDRVVDVSHAAHELKLVITQASAL